MMWTEKKPVPVGRVLRAGKIHLFTPHTSVEHMMWADVPGTVLGPEVPGNKNTALASRTPENK